MLRFPVKKIRKQFKLLLLLVLLTFAVWFTYLHINQGKSIKLHFNYGKAAKSPVWFGISPLLPQTDLNHNPGTSASVWPLQSLSGPPNHSSREGEEHRNHLSAKRQHKSCISTKK
ncbi:N-acetyl-beta-glucosaminyl-glycoprotein 4-beta-N-acetylgalactosaminyltransferase 1 [Labeo rohita]|uniref:N-acetyl-beta-glucosaminyl-glycoprotein 4-beta-N-acetylgalactosaminyltransferase 1 n=1 Tax=Labeo rohita TaxID=84645 RepID=A0ABQ8LCY0_LABRO|nr:N-acetyl-beta-glucosaminyl-glycoprotein 4-beta-N-acetylgalactosaminyltransferase 1 [Labeo rohita]